MIDRTWLRRRFWAVVLLFPGYAFAWVGAQVVPPLTPFLPWNWINPYTVGAVISTVFNTVMWDRFVKVVYRLGGRPRPD